MALSNAASFNAFINKPMAFQDIEGHDKPVAILQRAIANSTLAHAYLFSGQVGIGKKTAALAFAAALNCTSRGPQGGCGQCPSCVMISARTHPDVRILMPESEDLALLATWSSKEIEKASTEIKIDQIRHAQEGISLKPSAGGRNVLIVDGAETLNHTAQNAFLKTLEEPPGEAMIILVTSLPQSLLPTIRSRCQEIKFQPLPRRLLAQVLMKKRGLTEEDAWFLAALAQGSLGRGLTMDIEQEKASREEIAVLLEGLSTMGAGELLAKAELLERDREQLERLFSQGIEWIRDTLVFRETGEVPLLIQGNMRERYRQFGEMHSRSRLLTDADSFVTGQELLERRISAKLVVENLLLNLGRLES